MGNVEPNEVLCVAFFLRADYFVMLNEFSNQDCFLSDWIKGLTVRF